MDTHRKQNSNRRWNERRRGSGVGDWATAFANRAMLACGSGGILDVSVLPYQYSLLEDQLSVRENMLIWTALLPKDELDEPAAKFAGVPARPLETPRQIGQRLLRSHSRFSRSCSSLESGFSCGGECLTLLRFPRNTRAILQIEVRPDVGCRVSEMGDLQGEFPRGFPRWSLS